MRVERTAEVLGYVECLDVWLPEDDERWLAYIRIGGSLSSTVSDCAEREFGGEPT
jgi:hypothetical protein